MDRKPEAIDPPAIDAGKFARFEAGQHARSEAKEDERAALDRAWREQAEYSRAVAELKDKSGRSAARRFVALAALAALAAAALAAFILGRQPEPPPLSEAEALRIASEARLRREEEARAGLAAEEMAKVEAGKPAADETPKPPRTEKATGKRPETEPTAQAQAQAMARAEERAKTVSAAAVTEAPRAAQRPGSVFQDCPDCPRMVVMPAGEFAMGSPAAEAGRGRDEGPQHQVRIARAFALGRSEVTVAQFRRFAEEAGYRTEAERDARAPGCAGFIYADPAARDPAPQSFTNWRSPGLAQAQVDSHPVLCVSWNDARAYAQWLAKKTGRRYRLPSEAEWEYAARAGSGAARPWGDDPVQACRFANVADQSRFQTWSFGQKHECTDGHYFSAPAGGYAPNRFGLYDTIGNVWEWTEDCWNASYAGAPTDGGAWLAGDCTQHVLRGGSWSTVPRYARSATRHRNPADFRDNLTGFRLARGLD